MLSKLQAVESRFEELCAKSEQPDFYADPKKAANLLREKNELEPIVETYRAYQTALLFSIGTAAIMLFLSGELGEVLYGSAEVARFIKILAPLIPIMYIDTATDALLKGLGEQVYSMNINIIDALISVVLVWILVPILGINGYLVTIYVTEIFNAAMSICRLLRVSGYRPKPTKLLLRPLACAVGATLLSNLLLRLGGGASASALSLLVHVLLVTALYLCFLVLSGTLPKSDLSWLARSLSPNGRATVRSR